MEGQTRGENDSYSNSVLHGFEVILTKEASHFVSTIFEGVREVLARYAPGPVLGLWEISLGPFPQLVSVREGKLLVQLRFNWLH